MKQTAVQWLIEQLEERGHIIPDHLENNALDMEQLQNKNVVEKIGQDRWCVLHRSEGIFQWIIGGDKTILKTEELIKKYL